MKIQAQAYFNQSAAFERFDPDRKDVFKSSEVVFVAETEPVRVAQLLETVFEKLNADDRPNGRTERSLSVGDVVVLVTERSLTDDPQDAVTTWGVDYVGFFQVPRAKVFAYADESVRTKPVVQLDDADILKGI